MLFYDLQFLMPLQQPTFENSVAKEKLLMMSNLSFFTMFSSLFKKRALINSFYFLNFIFKSRLLQLCCMWIKGVPDFVR